MGERANHDAGSEMSVIYARGESRAGMEFDRRTFLRAAAATGLAATAGCSESQLGGVGGSSEPARYSDFVASEAVGSDGATALSFDWAQLGALQEGTDTETPDTETPTPDEGTPGGSLGASDPLVAYPVGVLFAGLFGIGFASNLSGLGELTEFDGPTETAHFIGNGGIVFEGEFETDDVADAVEGAGFESIDSEEEADLFEREGAGTSATVGITEAIVVLVYDSGDTDETPTEVVQRLLDTEAGEIERYRESEDDFDQLVSRFSAGTIESVQYTPEDDVREDAEDEEDQDPESSATEFDFDGEIRGIASSASLTDTELTSRVALLFADEEEVPDEATIEDAVSGDASDREVTIDGRLVVVSGTYSGEDEDAPLV